MPTTQTRRIDIKVTSQGSKEVKRMAQQFGRMNKSIKRVDSNLNSLTRVFRTAIAGFGVREVVKSADSFQLLRDRIKVFTGDAEKANQVFNEIAVLARRTRSSIESFAEGYNRIAIATQGLNLSSDQTLGVVTALQQSLRLSGATAQEASSVFIQLGQALSLGRLQGQELRAVLLSNATVAKILADEFNTTTGNLKELGEQGRLTSDRVIKALANNFDILNKRADQLGTTFQQSLIIAFDQLRLEIDKINTKFGLNEKFFKGVDFLIKNLDELTTVIGALVGSGVILKLSAQISTFFTELAASGGLLQFGKNLNLTSLAIKAFLFLFTYVAIQAISDWELFTAKVSLKARELQIVFLALKIKALEFLSTLNLFKKDKSLEQFVKNSEKISRISLGKAVGKFKELTKEVEKLEKDRDQKGLDEFVNRLSNSMKKFNGTSINAALTQIGDLNKLLSMGEITLRQYQFAVESIQLQKLTEDFKNGKITADQFTNSVFKLNTVMSQVSNKTQIFEGVKAGALQASQSIGSVAMEVKNATVATIGELENRLLSFVKTGKFEFAQFAQFIADELTKVAIRTAVLQPILQGLGINTAPVTASAKGNVFQNGQVQPFANGGIVNSPTLFPMKNGTGLMGEAGPEAILPLERGPGGRLGVSASGGGTTVNIINNGNNEVETRETQNQNGEKQIDVLITDRVNKGIKEGKFDRSMSQTYGLSRRGN